MIRTLLIIAAVSFVFAVGCLSGAVAVAGGPFHIGRGLKFERVDTSGEVTTSPAILINGVVRGVS